MSFGCFFPAKQNKTKTRGKTAAAGYAALALALEEAERALLKKTLWVGGKREVFCLQGFIVFLAL